MSRKTNITELIDAKRLEADPEVEHKEFGPRKNRVTKIAPKTGLCIYRKDGTVLQEPDAATTFTSAIVEAFAMYVQGIQDGLPEDKKLSVFEVMALCEIRDGMKRPSNKEITKKLEQMGIIEKHGKTNAIYYILPRRYYELTGDIAAYSLATDWDINQVWAVILPFLQKYGKAKRSDFAKIVGGHLSEKQLRRL